MRIPILLAVCLLYYGADYYAGVRIFRMLKLLGLSVSAPAFAIAFFAVSSTVILSFFERRYGFQRIIYAAGSVWMGILLYLLLFTAAADIVILVFTLAGKASGTVKIAAEAAVLLLTAVAVAGGAVHASNIRTARYSVDSGKNTHPMKIVLVSDIHIGALGIENRLQKMADAVSAENADLVCIAGDVFNNDFSAVNNPEAVADAFRSIRSKHGVYACPGNHDSGKDFDKMPELLREAGVRLLSEEYCVIPERCIIAGRADRAPIGSAGAIKRGSFSSIGIPEDGILPVIVLDHNPAHIDEYGSEVDLVLSGHTHKGQLFPGPLITGRMYAVDYGMYRVSDDGPTAVVTSGIGYWGPPIRIGTDSEIAVIELR